MAIEDIYGLTFGALVLILVTLVTIVVIWQGLATYRARSSAVREEAYRKLAEEAVAIGKKNLETQQRITEVLDELRKRMASVEHLLKQVE